MTKWLLADLLVHCTFSDGEIPVGEIVNIYGDTFLILLPVKNSKEQDVKEDKRPCETQALWNPPDR